MLVKTYVAPSKIHGLGIFAQEYIPNGTIIWRYIKGFDRRYTQEEINKLPKQAKEYIGTYGWRSAKSGLICIGLDNDKYFNHSETPNSLSEYRDNEIGSHNDSC
jgi:SET domain-containing protein